MFALLVIFRPPTGLDRCQGLPADGGLFGRAHCGGVEEANSQTFLLFGKQLAQLLLGVLSWGVHPAKCATARRAQGTS